MIASEEQLQKLLALYARLLPTMRTDLGREYCREHMEELEQCLGKGKEPSANDPVQ